MKFKAIGPAAGRVTDMVSFSLEFSPIGEGEEEEEKEGIGQVLKTSSDE